MRSILLSALAALALPLCGFSLRPLTPDERALVNHAANTDPAWTTLADTEVVESKDKGLMFARFSPLVTRLNGEHFSISGFVILLEANGRLRHFILTRRDATCPFCPPNTSTEAVEVTLDQPAAVPRGQVRVEGRLALVSTSDTSLFCRVISAKLEPASPTGDRST